VADDDGVDITFVGPVAVLHLDNWAAGNRFTEITWMQLWAKLGADPRVLSTAAVVRLGAAPELDLSPIGPKAAGMVRPFVLGLDGYIVGSIYELVEQADAVIATNTSKCGPPDVAIAALDTHAVRRLPLQELARLALLQEEGAMSVRRARQLGFVDEVVTPEELEIATIRRAQEMTAG
jgi:enoyl-CoA hydratase/carnithine racemase